MHRRLLTLLTVVLLATAGLAPIGTAVAENGAQDAASCEYPFTVTDATGTEVTVEEAPQRVVVVGGSATQTMWEIGAKDKVVGLWVSPYTTYLDGAAERPTVASQYGYADVEKVLKQNPDLVLLANIQKNETAEKLREAGVTVYKYHAATSFQDIYEKTKLTGKLVGACEGAQETVSWMQERVQTVKEAMKGVEHDSMYFPMGYGYTPGPASFLTDVMQTAGARNIALNGNVSGVTAKVTSEFVVEQNPEWLLATYNPVLVNETPSGKDALKPVLTDAINRTQAYKAGNIVVVNGNYLSQPAPRVVYPLMEIAKTLHPEAWAEANGTTAQTTTEATAPTTTAAATTTGSTPGFGLATGVVALLGALFLARRR